MLPRPRLSRRWLLGYWIFVVYGSLIPFIFNLDPNFVEWRVGVFLSRSLYRGITHWIWVDVIVNILLYVPLGLLGLASLRRDRWLARSPVAPLVIGVLGLGTGLAVEFGQTLAPYRSPSMLDAFCNGFGALLGAIVGFFLLLPRSRAFGSRLARIARTNPAQSLALILIFALLVENYYPFILTNELALRFNVVQALRLRFWPADIRDWIDICFDPGLTCAVLGFALYCAHRPTHPNAALKAWLQVSFAAAIIEAGTVFFVASRFQLVDIFASSAGALLGVTIVPALASLDWIKSRRNALLLIGILVVLGYFELRPFDWIHANQLPIKMRRIEWLPFISYYRSRPQAAIFDLTKKLFLGLPLGCLFAAASPLRAPRRRLIWAVGASGFVVLLLEICQLALRSHVTSVTDVLVFTFGAWLGAQTFDWFTYTAALSEHESSEPGRIETASVRAPHGSASATNFDR